MAAVVQACNGDVCTGSRTFTYWRSSHKSSTWTCICRYMYTCIHVYVCTWCRHVGYMYKWRHVDYMYIWRQSQTCRWRQHVCTCTEVSTTYQAMYTSSACWISSVIGRTDYSYMYPAQKGDVEHVLPNSYLARGVFFSGVLRSMSAIDWRYGRWWLTGWQTASTRKSDRNSTLALLVAKQTEIVRATRSLKLKRYMH